MSENKSVNCIDCGVSIPDGKSWWSYDKNTCRGEFRCTKCEDKSRKHEPIYKDISEKDKEKIAMDWLENGPLTPGRLIPVKDLRNFIPVPMHLTLRQYYKTHAMAGELASRSEGLVDSEILATICGRFSDAMIKEDEKHDLKKNS